MRTRSLALESEISQKCSFAFCLRRQRKRRVIAVAIFLFFPFLLSAAALAQDRLKSMPGYERYQRMSREITNAVKFGLISADWKDEGRSFEFAHDGKRFRYDIATRTKQEIGAPGTNMSNQIPEGRRGRRVQPGAPARGRQFTFAISPDGKWKAFYRDRNLWLSDTNGANELAITTDGDEKSRIKYGTASWVYGEELDQNTAIWWPSNSQKVAFYRFDEGRVQDFHLQLDQTKLYSRADIEPYPKVGTTNPVVDVLIYDLTTKKIVTVDVRDGGPFDNAVVGHYVYRVMWSHDSKALLFSRTNRRQNVMELCAADPETGKSRVILREEWLSSWTENSPTLQFLADGQRFVWASERTGWRNFYLYNLSGQLLARLTDHAYEVGNIVRIDEQAGVLYYTARSGDNPMKLQLHRVGLDGQDDRRLTDPAFHHSVDLAPDCQHFLDVAQTHDSPPVTRLVDRHGRILDEIVRSDASKFRKLGLKPVELLKFKAADGETELYGLLHFPSDFRPSKKYPLLVSVYGGPATAAANENFVLPSILTELGFLVAAFDARTVSGRGKHFLDAIYLKLGQLEIDDQAAGVKALWNRPYLDRRRVGIFGTSYGGTASALCLLRYPEVFHAASASSAVTDFRNYDTIYTERYMWIPEQNKEGYERVNLMNFVKNLQGRLMLFYGTADDNVHPNNTMQLVQALQRAGKSFEVQVGPDQGHASLNRERMMEFFIENLVLRSDPTPKRAGASSRK